MVVSFSALNLAMRKLLLTFHKTLTHTGERARRCLRLEAKATIAIETRALAHNHTLPRACVRARVCDGCGEIHMTLRHIVKRSDAATR